MNNPNTLNDHLEADNSAERDEIKEVLQKTNETQEEITEILTTYAKNIAEAKEIAHRAEVDCNLKIKKIISKKRKEGWRTFPFHSDYNGTHPERGCKDIRIVYIFHPKIDFSRWENVNFTHLTNSQSEHNEAFAKWIGNIPRDKYVEIEIEF
jgi:hypothetical protein